MAQQSDEKPKKEKKVKKEKQIDSQPPKIEKSVTLAPK